MFSRKTVNTGSNIGNGLSESPYVSDEELNKMLPEALEDISKAESKAKYIHIYILGSFVEKSLFNLHFFVF